MRILQVVALVSPDGAFGGPARVALNQSAELVRRGHDVLLAAGAKGYPLSTREVDGVPVRLFAARTLVPGTGFPGMGAPGLASWFRHTRTCFDTVHIHFGRDLVVLPMAMSARRRHIPYVLQTHGMVVPSGHPLAGPLDAVCTRRALRGAEAVLYLTEQERSQVSEVARAPLNLIQVGNGVPDYSTASKPPGPPEVLFVARLHARKHPMKFVDMAKTLLGEGLNARFTLVGPDEGEGAAVRAAIGAEQRIAWEGPLPPAAIATRMAAAAIYVLPSEREPYPMSVLEAMSVGLPVVISADCGLAPLVERARCGVVTDGETPAFVAAVRSMLTDEAAARAMGKRARETALSEFGMRAIGEQLIDIYATARGTY
jgi:glycosyltransferase involved in cell wall biosynthesis